MLERTFIHIPKIGYITEQRLWQAGIGDWSQVCSSSKAPRGFSARRWVEVQRHCEQSRQHLVAKAGLPEWVHPHTLRHSAAQRLSNSTGNIELVRKFLGHKTVTTTQVYAKANDKDVQESAIDLVVQK